MACQLCNVVGTTPGKPCRNCKYGGNTCRRCGPDGETCDLYMDHRGPHSDRELNKAWFDRGDAHDAGPGECCCSLRTIMINGCKCGGS